MHMFLPKLEKHIPSFKYLLNYLLSSDTTKWMEFIKTKKTCLP